ncbi:MAG: hypothetical protein ACK4SY_08165 [Pyrobaculum sp.]
MPKYARLAVDYSLARQFYQKMKKIGKKPAEVVTAVLSTAVEVVDHGYDPIDMIHICRIVRALGVGRGGYSQGLAAGRQLRLYYTPAEFLEILTRVGPKALGLYKTGPDTYKADPETAETIKGLLAGIGCHVEQDGNYIKPKCTL